MNAVLSPPSLDDIKTATDKLPLTHANMVALITIAEQFANAFNQSGRFNESMFDLCDRLTDALIVAERVYAEPRADR